MFHRFARRRINGDNNLPRVLFRGLRKVVLHELSDGAVRHRDPALLNVENVVVEEIAACFEGTPRFHCLQEIILRVSKLYFFLKLCFLVFEYCFVCFYLAFIAIF